MIAYLGQESIKQQKLAQITAHELADEIVQGVYWENGKGCAVGCTIHGDDHSLYETEMGIPVELAKLQDAIFEGLTNGDAKQFPRQFLEAIAVGADLSRVWNKFAVWLLIDPNDGVIRFADNDKERGVIQAVAALHQRTADGDTPSEAEWAAVRDAAWAAAWDAARDAAWAAVRAAVRDAAWAAAWDAARAAARDTAYIKQRDKLLELLREVPIVESA